MAGSAAPVRPPTRPAQYLKKILNAQVSDPLRPPAASAASLGGGGRPTT